MKNREKYKDELMGAIKADGRLCGFIKHHDVFRKYEMKGEYICGGIDCTVCSVVLNLWLDEEYEEPEVDWGKVPVDTLVRVRDFATDVGVLRYFKGIDDSNPVERFVAWADGKTSVTANGSCTNWAFCELVEDEE